jgi:GNAT superfamily N-acetyltransferase
MIDAATYDTTATLRSGMKVRVRSIRSDDKQRLVTAFKNLEPESIYTRFFYHKKTLSEAELQSATELDFEKAVALVVTTGDGEHEAIIGAGRYAVIEETGPPRSAEVAFTVEEDYHRQGMARILLQHLASIARAKGLSIFVAEVLSGNSGMLTVFARSGLPMKTEHGGDAVHVTLSLTGGRS